MSVSEEFKQVVGRRIRELRDAAGLRQIDVALAVDPSGKLHLMRVSEWERGVGTPNAEQVAKLAALFRVSSDAIVGGVTSDNVSPLPEKQDGTPVQSDPVPDAAA